jgi:putative cell wall-binding protein
MKKMISIFLLCALLVSSVMVSVKVKAASTNTTGTTIVVPLTNDGPGAE